LFASHETWSADCPVVACECVRFGGLADRDVDPRTVLTDVRNEVSASVDDGDVHGLADLGSLLLGC